MKIADPRPALCTACGNSCEEGTRFVDCEAVREGPVVLDRETGQIAVGPDGAQVSLEDVFICEGCVREQAEVIGYKPELHSRQFTAIRQKELQVEHWRASAGRARRESEHKDEYIRLLEAALDGAGKPRPQRSRRAA